MVDNGKAAKGAEVRNERRCVLGRCSQPPAKYRHTSIWYYPKLGWSEPVAVFVGYFLGIAYKVTTLPLPQALADDVWCLQGVSLFPSR